MESRAAPSKRTRGGTKNARNRRNRRARVQARQLLDKAFQEYLASLAPSKEQDSSVTSTSHPADLRIPTPPPPSPEPSPLSPSRSPQQPSESPPSSPSTIIFESPLLSPVIDPSYSPISSPEPSRPSSPANSTSSVEFIEEFPPQQRGTIPSRIPPFSQVITEFTQSQLPLAAGTFTIGPDSFDPQALASYISTASPEDYVGVFWLEEPLPYLVPVPFFYTHFPPSTTTIEEVE